MKNPFAIVKTLDKDVKAELAKKTLSRTFRSAHIGYLGAVFFEGHGLHSWFGGAMLALAVVGVFIHFEE